MAKVTVGFTLDTEEDRRIIRWLESLPKGDRSKAIREALHAHLGRGSITLGDIYEAIQDLKRTGLVVTSALGSPASEVDLPPDVLEKLDNLGL